jgi:predicted neuraminidase
VIASPLFGVGVLVRGAPAAYDDGTIALPVYHELGTKWPAIARVDRDGHVLDLHRILDGRPLIQPSLAVTSRDDATMLFRYSAGRSPLSVTMAFTNDAGLHWSQVAGTPLVHRDSGVAAVRTTSGLLAFYNNTAWDRRDLSVAWTPDNGRHWSMPKPIERDTTPDYIVRREYSYPYAIRTRDGRTHLVYTWQRTRIAHVVFNDAWLRADAILGGVRR